jgi:hypothetical protein
LAFLEALESFALDIRVVHEEILAAVVGDYEAIALLITEPFYRTLSQSNLPYAPYREASGTLPSIALEIGPEGQRPTHTRQ